MKRIITIKEGMTNCDKCPFLAYRCHDFVLMWLGIDCNKYDLDTLKHEEYNEPKIEEPSDMTEKDGYNGVVLFGMPYLWYGDIAFHNSMWECDLIRGLPVLCGKPNKAIMANKREFFLVDYYGEESFCEKYGLVPTYTVDDFVEEILKLKYT